MLAAALEAHEDAIAHRRPLGVFGVAVNTDLHNPCERSKAALGVRSVIWGCNSMHLILCAALQLA